MELSQELESRYEVLEKLGEGGMGSVYKVRHRLLGTTCVSKVIREHLKGSEERRQRFLREARVAAQLRHPNIAQVTDFAMDRTGSAFLVMEYVEGINLEELITRVGLPGMSLAAEIARQGLAALDHLHGRHLVHRDISPDNLMLTRSEDGAPLVKLIDLGIATSVLGDSRLTETGLFIGKPHYAAPEQFGGATGDAVADARSDLYSFGVVLYRLLTGHFPIDGKDPRAIIAGHLVRSPRSFAETDPKGHVPEPLRAITLKALAKKPADRYQSAGEFIAALDATAFAPNANNEVIRRQVAVIAERAQAITGRAVPCGSTSLKVPILGDLPPLPAGDTTGPPLEASAAAPHPPRPTTPAASVAVAVGEETMLEPSRPLRRRSHMVLAAAVVAALALVVVLLTTMSRREPPAPPLATVVVDAVPWAEIEAVRTSRGEPIDLARPSFTPARLVLPVGTYRVELRHRDFGTKTVTVEAVLGTTTEHVVRFTEAPASEVLERLGL